MFTVRERSKNIGKKHQVLNKFFKSDEKEEPTLKKSITNRI